MAVYFIHEDNLDDLEDVLKKIERKCKKLGCEYHYEKLGEEFREETIDGEKRIEKFIKVDVTGTPIINGWEVVAKIDHLPEGVVVRKIDKDFGVPLMYLDPKYNHCEHCNSMRSRKYVYIVRHIETGETKQVGASCLKDFTGGLDAESAALLAQYIKDAEEYNGRSSLRGGYRTYYETEMFLQYAIECVNKFGYFNSQCDYPTKTRAAEYFRVKELGFRNPDAAEEMEDVCFDATSPRNCKYAVEILNYIKSIDPSNEYETTLKTLANCTYLEVHHLGYVSSMVPFYQRKMNQIKNEDERKKSCSVSQYVGEISSKIEFRPASVELVTSSESVYGYSYLYRIKDESGNVFIWWSTRYFDNDLNSIVSVKGTVKDHEEYKGLKQTVLTRCKFIF